MDIQTQFAVATPSARNSDPVTSHLAADDVTGSCQRSAQQHEVYSGLLKHPGMTSRELAKAIDMDRHAVARRLPELIQAEKGEKRQCAITGKLCVTWWPVSR